MAAAFEGERFDIGRTVSRGFAPIGRHPALFLGLALLFGILPNAVVRGFAWSGIASASALGGIAAGLLTVVASLVGFVCVFILQASVIHAAVVDLNGGVPSLGASVRPSLSLILPLIGLAIVSGLGYALGFALLLVPGIILLVVWSVAVPALVEERGGIMGSLARSRELTKGARWRIFATLIVVGVIVYLPSMVLTFAGGGIAAAALRAQSFSVAGVLLIVFNGLASMILAAMVAAIYLELRTVKEGASKESLASIFA